MWAEMKIYVPGPQGHPKSAARGSGALAMIHCNTLSHPGSADQTHIFEQNPAFINFCMNPYLPAGPSGIFTDEATGHFIVIVLLGRCDIGGWAGGWSAILIRGLGLLL